MSFIKFSDCWKIFNSYSHILVSSIIINVTILKINHEIFYVPRQYVWNLYTKSFQSLAFFDFSKINSLPLLRPISRMVGVPQLYECKMLSFVIPHSSIDPSADVWSLSCQINRSRRHDCKSFHNKGCGCRLLNLTSKNY